MFIISRAKATLFVPPALWIAVLSLSLLLRVSDALQVVLVTDEGSRLERLAEVGGHVSGSPSVDSFS